MYKINQDDLEVFNKEIFKSYLLEVTFEKYKKYPLVNKYYSFVEVFNFVEKLYLNYINLGFKQRRNIEYWVEIHFVFGFNFLNYEYFFKLKKLINFNDALEMGELNFSMKIYEEIKSVSEGFDDFIKIKDTINLAKVYEKNFENFSKLMKINFQDFFNYLGDELFWMEFFLKFKSRYTLDEIVLKALRFDLDFSRLEVESWE